MGDNSSRLSKALMMTMLVVGTLVLASLACDGGAPTPTPAPTATPAPISVADIVEALTPSTVLIYAEFADGASTGSGIIYDESGLTITNAHVVEGAAIIKVYVQGAERWLSAQLVGISTCEDLAVIDISGDGYTPAPLGDSNQLTLGEDVIAIGYPLASELGAEPTINRGVVSKLHAQLDELQDMIQTDVDINPGNSGGPLVNMRGEVVGINTAKIEYTTTGRPVTGINFSIPSSYARPTIEELASGNNLYWLGANILVNDADVASYFNLAVENGLFVYAISDSSPAIDVGLEPGDVLITMKGINVNSVADMCDILRSNPEGNTIPIQVMRGSDLLVGEVWGEKIGGPALAEGPAFGPISFAEGVTDDNQPINPTTIFTVGTTEVYAFFDFSKMQDGMEWGRTWYFEGEEDVSRTETWDIGESGTTWLRYYNEEGLASGSYRLELYVEGELLQSGTFVIGEEATGLTVGSFTFAVAVDENNNCLNPQATFPAGTSLVYTCFAFAGMQDGMAVRMVWLHDGQTYEEGEATWQWGEEGNLWWWVGSEDPTQGQLDPGRYDVQLYVEGQLVQTGSFVVGEEIGSPSFGPVTFAEGVTDDNQPINPDTSFPTGTTEIYAVFDYSRMENGMEWTSTWYRDGELDITDTWEWEQGQSGTWWLRLFNTSGVIPGNYRVELYVEGQLLQTGTMTVAGER